MRLTTTVLAEVLNVPQTSLTKNYRKAIGAENGKVAFPYRKLKPLERNMLAIALRVEGSKIDERAKERLRELVHERDALTKPVRFKPNTNERTEETFSIESLPLGEDVILDKQVYKLIGEERPVDSIVDIDYVPL